MILSGSEEGKKIVSNMVDEIIDELKGYDYEDASVNTQMMTTMMKED